MGNDNQYRSKAPQVNQVYEIYKKSFKEIKNINQIRHSKTQMNSVYSQLFESFQAHKKYSWGKEIKPLFISNFGQSFQKIWDIDCEKFYRELNYPDKTFSQTSQEFFYRNNKQAFKKSSSFKDKNQKIKALNSSIIDGTDDIPIIVGQKSIQQSNELESLLTDPQGLVNNYLSLNNEENDKSQLSQLFCKTYESECPKSLQNKQIHHLQIQRSSVIIPETVFINRLQETQKTEVIQMLDFYKKFSKSLQQLIKSVSLISCPIKHFETSLKKKLHDKKILKQGLKTKVLSSHSKKSCMIRKKHQYNNNIILMELKDFIQAYTEFIWKYLGLYQIQETYYKEYITIQTVHGIVFKVVWQFVTWIGNRGYQYEEMKLLSIVKKDYPNKIKNQIQKYIIEMGCSLSKEKSPQRYLKQVVLIYRQLSKDCDNADKLLSDYQTLIYAIINSKCSDRLLRMHRIINKLLKIDESNGQIEYAWTTWSIIIKLLEQKLRKEDKQVAELKGFELLVK